MAEAKYSTVSFTVSWLPGSIGFTEQAKTVMADQLNLDRRIIRGSYAILGASRDPLIKEGSALKRVLSLIRDEFTIPECTLTQASGNLEKRPVKIKGSYIIENLKVGEFLERFDVARTAYLNWGQRFLQPENYERIKESDKLALGQDWALISSKYPTAEELADAIQCDIPKIMPYDTTFDVADLAPATMAYLKQNALERMEASINGAMFEFIHELKDMVNTVAKSCGRRIRVMPVENSKFAMYRNAEVQEIYTHEEDNSIPMDSYVLVLQPAKTNPDGKIVQEGKPINFSCTKEDYRNLLRPYETGESKQLTTAGFEHLMFLTNKLGHVKNLLGSNDQVEDLVKEVQDSLTSFGKSAADITKEIKSSAFTRTSAKQAFQDLHTKIVDTEITLKQQQNHPRRRIAK